LGKRLYNNRKVTGADIPFLSAKPDHEGEELISLLNRYMKGQAGFQGFIKEKRDSAKLFWYLNKQ